MLCTLNAEKSVSLASKIKRPVRVWFGATHVLLLCGIQRLIIVIIYYCRRIWSQGFRVPQDMSAGEFRGTGVRFGRCNLSERVRVEKEDLRQR